MFNPFLEKKEEHENDVKLIQRILDGSRSDLEKLIFRHQAWIYNISLKMVMDPTDAEDVTQEILIKLVTKLSTYNPKKGSFRTWLYRIVANHVINMKKRKYEYLFTSFEESISAAEKIPDESIESCPESRILIEELKIKCWTGMLLCLNRKQRLVFILGGIFDIPDSLGSEIMEISKPNFRQILSRARKKINNFMNQNCGLINKNNPCHCSKKLNGFIQNGFIQPDEIQFYQIQAKKIKDAVYENLGNVQTVCRSENISYFQEHPFYKPPDVEAWVRKTFTHQAFKDLIDVN